MVIAGILVRNRGGIPDWWLDEAPLPSVRMSYPAPLPPQRRDGQPPHKPPEVPWSRQMAQESLLLQGQGVDSNPNVVDGFEVVKHRQGPLDLLIGKRRLGTTSVLLCDLVG